MKKKIKRIIGIIVTLYMFVVIVPCVRAADIKIGDYIQMGIYYGEPILWRCVGIDSNGPLILSDKIICLKPFDARPSFNIATGSHSRGIDRSISPSNYWQDSNIRSWLNSLESAGNVKWLCGNPPVKDCVARGYNSYESEAGFLTNFTSDELMAIEKVSQTSPVSYPEYERGVYTIGYEPLIYNYNISDIIQNYNNAFSEEITDRIFLLDVKQLNEVYNKSSLLGNAYHVGKPTTQAVNNSEYKDSSLIVGENYFYWLRTPCSQDVDTVYVVNTDGNHASGANAYSCGIGVRPAFFMNNCTEFKKGDGTLTNPYSVPKTTLHNIEAIKSSNSITIKNSSDYDDSATVIIAQYISGVLTNINFETKHFNASEEYTIYCDSKGLYKVFAWDSLEGMRPLCEAKTVTVK